MFFRKNLKILILLVLASSIIVLFCRGFFIKSKLSFWVDGSNISQEITQEEKIALSIIEKCDKEIYSSMKKDDKKILDQSLLKLQEIIRENPKQKIKINEVFSSKEDKKIVYAFKKQRKECAKKNITKEKKKIIMSAFKKMTTEQKIDVLGGVLFW